jgi:hypothetical protein
MFQWACHVTPASPSFVSPGFTMQRAQYTSLSHKRVRGLI